MRLPDTILGRNWRLFLRKSRGLIPRPLPAALAVLALIVAPIVGVGIADRFDHGTPRPTPVTTTSTVNLPESTTTTVVIPAVTTTVPETATLPPTP